MNKILLFLLLALVPSFVFAEPLVVNSKTKTFLVSPTIDTNAYATGDLVGPKQTLTNVGTCNSLVSTPVGLCGGIISSVVITDLEKQSGDFDIVIFGSDPTGTTFTDNAAFDIADADISKVICVISVTTDVLLSDNGLAVNQSANCTFDAKATEGTLYAAAVIRSAATYSASGLTFRYGILQD